jgi:phosphoglycolate phosphatase-like HAD superfamily hydrolase
VAQSKPYPDIFAAAMKKVRNPPIEDVIVIGDTPYDAKAADKLKLRTIGVLCGERTAAALLPSGLCSDLPGSSGSVSAITSRHWHKKP